MGYGLPEWLGDTPLPKWVTPEQALRLQDRKDAVLIDCRDPVGMGNGAGYADGSPEGAVNLSATATIMFPEQV
jgi:rhodanese-related sulfurtransferase